MAIATAQEGAVTFYNVDSRLSKKAKVFYNPRMKLPRDVSIEIAKHYKVKKFVDCMASSGIRSLRLMKEASCGYGSANDLNPSAAKIIAENAYLNKINLEITNKDCCELDYCDADYIDVDPFGSPAPFMEKPVAEIKKNAILALTATDIGVLNGKYPSTCIKRYLANSQKCMFSKELGARILLGYAVRMAAHYEKNLIPIFAHAHEHYLRVYLQAKKQPLKKTLKNITEITYCAQCHQINKEPCCKTIRLGPIWAGKIYDTGFTKEFTMIKNIPEEAKLPIVGYYNVLALLRKRPGNLPSTKKLIEAIQQKGYKASKTHFEGAVIKTDMPLEEFRKIITVD